METKFSNTFFNLYYNQKSGIEANFDIKIK